MLLARRIRWWLRRQAAPAVMALVILSAVGLSVAPFLGVAIPVATATVAAAFLGALVAVLWATWSAKRRQTETHREVALALRELIDHMPTEIEFIERLAWQDVYSIEDDKAMRDACQILIDQMQEVVEDITDLLQHLGSIGATSITGVLAIRRNLRRLIAVLVRLSRDAPFTSGMAAACGRELNELRLALEVDLDWLRSF